MKKTKEHLKAEKNVRGKIGEELKEAKRNLAKQRRYRARRTIQGLQKGKNKNEGCHALYSGIRTTGDRQKWKEELEIFPRGKYQDERMRMKAKKELEEWEERIKKQKDEAGKHQAPRLTMSVVMRSRASFSN